MKPLAKYTLLSVGIAALATTALALTYTYSIRLLTSNYSFVAFARDNSTTTTPRYAYLFLNSSGTYSVYVAGKNITGSKLCSSGLYTATRPAISRDGKIVTFWACASSTDKTIRAYYCLADGTSGPVTAATDNTYSTTLLTSPSAVDLWPPQASNIQSDSSFMILFPDKVGRAIPVEANCTINPGGWWKNGQLYEWPSGGTPSIVSTAGTSVDGCAYLATSQSGDSANIDSPASVDTYSIGSNPVSGAYKVTWSAVAGNQMSGVTQNHEQIIYANTAGSTGRELISKNASGTEGNGNSNQESTMVDATTNDIDKVAFASTAQNLTSFASYQNSNAEIFCRTRVGTTSTISAFNLSLNNTGSLNDGACRRPTISGNGNYIAFETYSTDLVTYHSTASPAYAIGSTPFCFLSDLTSPYLDSYKYLTPTDWRTGQSPSINYDASLYGFHSAAGDIASPTETDGLNSIYELHN